MASKNSTQTIALLAIGGFILYEFMKNQSSAAQTNPLSSLAGDISGLFGGRAGGAGGGWGGIPNLPVTAYDQGSSTIGGPGSYSF